MKKLISLSLVLLMLLALATPTWAAADPAPSLTEVLVTVADKGVLTVTQLRVTVTDTDGDGALTVNDALVAAHNVKYEGGADAGYAVAETQWGLSITKLWGDVSGNYGYYVNNTSAMSLTDPVADGDRLTAFVYSDGVGYSDTYCYFDVNTASGKEGDTLTLTLSAAGYDAEWNPVTLPLADATITVNGVATAYKTDAEGKVTLILDQVGTLTVSATSDTAILVPPVCLVTVEAKVPVNDNTDAVKEPAEAPDTAPWIYVAIGGAVLVVALAAILILKGKKK